MKKFISDTMTEREDVFSVLIDVIDSNVITDRNTLLKDIIRHDLLKVGNRSLFGTVRIHTASSQAIKGICLACKPFSNGMLEVLVLWDTFSEHCLDILSCLLRFFEKMANQKKSNEEIISELKKM